MLGCVFSPLETFGHFRCTFLAPNCAKTPPECSTHRYYKLFHWQLQYQFFTFRRTCAHGLTLQNHAVSISVRLTAHRHIQWCQKRVRVLSGVGNNAWYHFLAVFKNIHTAASSSLAIMIWMAQFTMSQFDVFHTIFNRHVRRSALAVSSETAPERSIHRHYKHAKLQLEY